MSICPAAVRSSPTPIVLRRSGRRHGNEVTLPVAFSAIRIGHRPHLLAVLTRLADPSSLDRDPQWLSQGRGLPASVGRGLGREGTSACSDSTGGGGALSFTGPTFPSSTSLEPEPSGPRSAPTAGALVHCPVLRRRSTGTCCPHGSRARSGLQSTAGGQTGSARPTAARGDYRRRHGPHLGSRPAHPLAHLLPPHSMVDRSCGTRTAPPQLGHHDGKLQ